MRIIAATMLALTLLLYDSALAQHIETEAALAERVLGDPRAPVTIVAYESLSCPHCAAFHRDTFEDLKARYIDTGKVYFIYRDFPLNGPAVRAAMLARCTAAQRYFGTLQVLYRTQERWLQADDAIGELERLGRLAGVDGDAFRACMADEDLFDGIVAGVQRAAEEFEVNSTPSFVINGTLYAGNRSIEEFSRIIDPLLPAN